jgi:hypothetical protein
MQKALRVCTMKAVDWIAGTSLAYRRQVALRSSPPALVVEKPSALKKPGAEKKSDTEQVPSAQSTRKPDLVERSVAEKPEVEKRTTGKSVVEKLLPKKEAPQSEEWGQ